MTQLQNNSTEKCPERRPKLNFELLRYGEVYQAVELKTGAKVAIKLDTRNNSEMEREIEYLKLLNGSSEHIPQILEYGRFSGFSYFVLTLLGKNCLLYTSPSPRD